MSLATGTRLGPYEILHAIGAGGMGEDVLAAIVTRDPDWSALPPALPPGVRRLLARCLTRDPRLRLRDIGGARILLSGSLDDVATTPLPAATRRVPAYAVATVLALVALVAGYLLGQRAQAGPPRLLQTAFQQLTDQPGREHQPTISPDGRYIYFASSRGGTMNLWRVAMDEHSGRTLGAPEPITTPTTWSGHFDFAADGRTLVFSDLDERSAIHVATFDPLQGRLIGPSRQVLQGRTINSIDVTRERPHDRVLAARADMGGARHHPGRWQRLVAHHGGRSFSPPAVVVAGRRTPAVLHEPRAGPPVDQPPGRERARGDCAPRRAERRRVSRLVA